MRNLHLGIDFGHYEIKLTALEEDSNGQYLTYNFSILNNNFKGEEILNKENIINLLDDFLATISSNLSLNYIGEVCVGFNVNNLNLSLQKSHTILDNYVKREDVEKALKIAKTSLLINHQEVILAEILKFIIDGQQEIRDPIGIEARKLDIEVLFITCHEIITQKLRDIFKEIKIKNIKFLPSFYASSRVALSKRDKEVGVALLDLGAEITTLSIFKNNKLVNFKNFNFGGETITQDLAMHLRIDLEEAEEIKKNFFNKSIKEMNKKNLRSNKIKNFLEKRIKYYFEESGLKNYFKNISKEIKLPAGLILIGGFSSIINLDNLIKNIFDCQVKLPKDELNLFKNKEDIIKFSASAGCALELKNLLNKNENLWEKIKNFFSFKAS